MANSITNRVRELRALTFRGEVSQKQLAERAGIDPSTLSDIENQKAQPSIETALALARVFGCSVEDLFLPSDIAVEAMDSPPSAASANGSAAATAPSAGILAAEPPGDRTGSETPAGDGAEEPVG